MDFIRFRQDEKSEKKFLPRLPFTPLTFREDGKSNRKTFEVRDVSQEGMRLALKEGEHSYCVGFILVGWIRLKGESLRVQGEVRWVKGQTLGVRFFQDKKLKKGLNEFLGPKSLIKGIKNICDLEIDLPSGLKAWTCSDTGFETFVWCHENGGISGFQILFAGNIVEWREEHNIRTGEILYLRSRNGPLNEEEFLFDFECVVDETKLSFAKKLIGLVTEKHLPKNVLMFIRSILSPTHPC